MVTGTYLTANDYRLRGAELELQAIYWWFPSVSHQRRENPLELYTKIHADNGSTHVWARRWTVGGAQQKFLTFSPLTGGCSDLNSTIYRIMPFETSEYFPPF